MKNHHKYLTKRLIDTCLREDLFGIVSQASILHTPLDAAANWDQLKTHQHWLIFSIEEHTLYLPIEAGYYMQHWFYFDEGWLQKYQGKITKQSGYEQWIQLLKVCASEGSQALLEAYLEELQCAESHGLLCDKAYHSQKKKLSHPFSELTPWDEQLLLADQIASYLDHPYYPTARAKFGFNAQDLVKYAPEYSNSFALNWLAVEKSLVTLTSNQPDCWPTMEAVGLPADFALSHVLIPAHPLTFSTLNTLPQGIIKAPNAVLDVVPTLSVRTVVVKNSPETHIKVPLVMRTLGTKNIRLIKPSTIYDGHWFERLLAHLEQTDQRLHGLYFHCDEQHGGHVGEDKTFAYIVRSYPLQHASEKALIPVAALAGLMPDSRLFLEHLAEQYYHGDILQWFTDYVNLLNQTHLTLWLRYGIALESNQQNAILAISREGKMSLAMKDNDAARIWPKQFKPFEEHAPVKLGQLLDQRILVEDEQALAQMYTTITLQLDIAAIVEAMAHAGVATSATLYTIVRRSIENNLDELESAGCNTGFARQHLLEDDFFYAKYLLSSGSLLSKQASGAEDINKFYGKSAPNFLKLTSEELQQDYIAQLTQLD